MSYKEGDVLVTNGEQLPGYKIVEIKGLVVGITVRS